MDRTEYLKMCQLVSVCENGICGIKKNLPDDLKVVCNGVVYYPISYELAFENGNPKHIAHLHCLNSKARTDTILEKVVKYEQSGSNTDDTQEWS